MSMLEIFGQDFLAENRPLGSDYVIHSKDTLGHFITASKDGIANFNIFVPEKASPLHYEEVLASYTDRINSKLKSLPKIIKNPNNLKGTLLSYPLPSDKIHFNFEGVDPHYYLSHLAMNEGGRQWLYENQFFGGSVFSGELGQAQIDVYNHYRLSLFVRLCTIFNWFVGRTMPLLS